MDNRGRVKLTDFGVAFRAGDTRLTRVGFAVGTPGYIAPEILDGADPTALTDIYAVGATARTLLAHQPYEPPPRLREFVDRATSPNPAHRPQSAWAALKLLTGRKAPSGSISPAGLQGSCQALGGLKDGALRLINGLAAGWLGFLLGSAILGRRAGCGDSRGPRRPRLPAAAHRRPRRDSGAGRGARAQQRGPWVRDARARARRHLGRGASARRAGT